MSSDLESQAAIRVLEDRNEGLKAQNEDVIEELLAVQVSKLEWGHSLTPKRRSKSGECDSVSQ